MVTPTQRSDGPKRSGSTGPSFYARRCGATSTDWHRRVTLSGGRLDRSTQVSWRSLRSRIGGLLRTGRIGPLMQRGEIWFAATPGGDRPVLVLTRDPVADRIGSVVVAALTRTQRGLVSELELTTADGVPSASVVNFDNVHTVRRESFRRRVATLTPARMAEACRAPASRNRLLTTGRRYGTERRHEMCRFLAVRCPSPGEHSRAASDLARAVARALAYRQEDVQCCE